MSKHIVVTGASGFLGSRLMQYLARCGHVVTGLDNRDVEYNKNYFEKLLPARRPWGETSRALFLDVDIANKDALLIRLRTAQCEQQKPIDFIVHLASKWSYDAAECATYNAENLQMTQNVAEMATQFQAKRLLFASSITAIDPDEELLSETSPLIDSSWKTAHPYAMNKADCERALSEIMHATPLTIMRIGGVYDSWCNLPPLNWMIDRWTRPSILGRIVPGRGETGVNFVSVHDFARFIARIIESDESLCNRAALKGVTPERCVFLCARHAASAVSRSHFTAVDLFRSIRRNTSRYGEPIFVPRSLIRVGFAAERFFSLFGLTRAPSEPKWLLNYVDKPLFTDTLNTISINWHAESDFLFSDMWTMLQKRRKYTQQWRQMQQNRENHAYRIPLDKLDEFD